MTHISQLLFITPPPSPPIWKGGPSDFYSLCVVQLDPQLSHHHHLLILLCSFMDDLLLAVRSDVNCRREKREEERSAISNMCVLKKVGQALLNLRGVVVVFDLTFIATHTHTRVLSIYFHIYYTLLVLLCYNKHYYYYYYLVFKPIWTSLTSSEAPLLGGLLYLLASKYLIRTGFRYYNTLVAAAYPHVSMKNKVIIIIIIAFSGPMCSTFFFVFFFLLFFRCFLPNQYRHGIILRHPSSLPLSLSLSNQPTIQNQVQLLSSTNNKIPDEQIPNTTTHSI